MNETRKQFIIIFFIGILSIGCSTKPSLAGTYLLEEGVEAPLESITINEDGTCILDLGLSGKLDMGYMVDKNILFVFSLSEYEDPSIFEIKKNKLILMEVENIGDEVCFTVYKKQNKKQSPQKEAVTVGYKDLLYDSPALLWGSSIKEVKSKYPNITESMFGGYDDDENNLNGKMQSRIFSFHNNQLYMVNISYGMYTEEEVDILMNELQGKYGNFLMEDDVSIKHWYVINEKNNQAVFIITYMGNYLVNCIYINQQIKNESYRYSFLE
jgi:hypothetical protein